MSPFLVLLLCWVGGAEGLGSAYLHSKVAAPTHGTPAAVQRAPVPVACDEAAAASSEEELVLTCSRCKASYVIDPASFGNGKQVKCTNCGHEWYQTAQRLSPLPPDMNLVEYPEVLRRVSTQWSQPHMHLHCAPRPPRAPQRTARALMRASPAGAAPSLDHSCTAHHGLPVPRTAPRAP